MSENKKQKSSKNNQFFNMNLETDTDQNEDRFEISELDVSFSVTETEFVSKDKKSLV